MPGLPHRLTPAEAEALGVGELLKAAIENGSYRPESGRAAVENVTGTAKTAGARSGQSAAGDHGAMPGKKNVTEE